MKFAPKRWALCALIVFKTGMLLNASSSASVSDLPLSATSDTGRPLVYGAQFKDLILPMPIYNGLETEGIFGEDEIKPRDKDNGMEQNDWSYWGGNPILGKDGNYYLAVARWPNTKSWQDGSEVALCVSDIATGPYHLVSTIVEKGHNPEVIKLKDGRFLLHTMSGVTHIADKMAGPWVPSDTMKFVDRNFEPSNSNNKIGANLTTERRPDGSIMLMRKWGDIAISKDGPFGPYIAVSGSTYPRETGYPEDCVIWRSAHQYHSLHNHDQDNRTYYMRSIDGINWLTAPGIGYGRKLYYEDGTMNDWTQVERPKIVQDLQGRAEYISLAAHDRANKNAKHHVLPLIKERFVSFVGDAPITADTKTMTLRIKAEDGFSPIKDVDVKSLRFGSAFAVDFGGGCKATGRKAEGDDLIVTFEGINGLTRFDYDFKLMGKTKQNKLLFGYALLPGFSATPAALISLPVEIKDNDGEKMLCSAIENWGLEDSAPQDILIYRYRGSDKMCVCKLKVDALKPYEATKILATLGKDVKDNDEFEIVMPGNRDGKEYWRMVNHTDVSVKFSGDWVENPKASKLCYMNSEKVSSTPGNTVEFEFTGTRAKAYGGLGRGMGTFKVYIDGKYIENVKCNRNATTHVVLYATEMLPQGSHILKLERIEDRNTGHVAIDSFAYESENNK